MKTTKQCPKCEGLAIGMFKLAVSAVNDDGSVSLGGSFPIDGVACNDCGYMEMFMQPISTWKKPPEEHGLRFTWLREPPKTEGPYR